MSNVSSLFLLALLVEARRATRLRIIHLLVAGSCDMHVLDTYIHRFVHLSIESVNLESRNVIKLSSENPITFSSRPRQNNLFHPLRLNFTREKKFSPKLRNN